ncbi:MAG: response regulator [Campylobacterota bacterium]|nr:response regulator [Campylobacterota bacterium]
MAEHGLEALNILKEEKFDGILMDCQMPVMDGYETTKQIRTQECFKDLPILALTANVMVDDKKKALDSGMNDQISKPILPTEMFKTIAKWMSPSMQSTSNDIDIKETSVADETLNYSEAKMLDNQFIKKGD